MTRVPSWISFKITIKCPDKIHSDAVCFTSINNTSYNGPISLQWCHKKRDGVSNHQPFIKGVVQRKQQNSASLAFMRGIHRWSVNSPYKGPVSRKMFPFDDVIMLAVVIPLCMASLPSSNLGACSEILQPHPCFRSIYDEAIITIVSYSVRPRCIHCTNRNHIPMQLTCHRRCDRITYSNTWWITRPVQLMPNRTLLFHIIS